MTVTRNNILLILLALAFSETNAQTARPGWPEIGWALLHPVAAIKIKIISKRCHPFYHDPAIKTQVDQYASGGQLDALRHVFYMAAYAQKIKARKVRKLGRAHERHNYRQFKRGRLEENERPDSLACEMDLLNNALGIKLGSENKTLALGPLRDLVVLQIRSGKAWILRRNAEGKYVTCSGDEISMEKYTEQWTVPKCLVPSADLRTAADQK